jgi:hypothetical protein
MATKALFNAGGIGNLAEDVSVHEHNGVPMTVHSFAEGYEPIASHVSRSYNVQTLPHSIDPLQFQQVGAMDFLTNNTDRHVGNLLVGDHTDERGYNPLLAIDHERNFQYAQNIHRRHMVGSSRQYDAESPLDYMDSGAMKYLEHHFDGWHQLSDWWKEKGPTISEEFMKQASMIKDPGVRQHVMNNFLARHRAMTEWAHNAHDWDIYDKHGLANAVKIQIQPEVRQRLTSRSLERLLPKHDPIGALGVIADVVNRRDKLRPNQQQTVRDTIRNLVTKMTPGEIAQVVPHVHQNPKFNTKKMQNAGITMRNDVLNHVRDYGTPDQQAAVAEAIDAMPQDQKEVLQHWADHMRRLARHAREAA